MTSAVHDYTYSVQVKSRFDLLASDDYNNEDPDLLLNKMRSQKHDSKAAAKESASKVASDKDSDKPAEIAQRGGRSDRRHGDEAAPGPRTESWEARGRGNRGRGGFTRSRPARSGGQREFDRHSGSDKTGVKAVVKKDGHGTGNWGTIEDELEAQMAETNLEAPIEEEAPAAEPAAEAEPAEEEPKTLTLKEYREQLKASKAKVQLTTKGSRRPNDGKNVFSNMVEVHKSKPAEAKVEVVLEDKPVEESKPQFFARPSSGRGRGPRPSGPGEFRGGRGGARFERREQEPVEGGAAPAPAPAADRPARGGRGGERGSRGGRGRGAPRGSFSSERGGGAPRGSFNPERGGGRGGAAGDRPSFRGGERGGRGSRGGPRGGFRGGRGGMEHHEVERRPGNSHAAPSMDSEFDFPTLK